MILGHLLVRVRLTVGKSEREAFGRVAGDSERVVKDSLTKVGGRREHVLDLAAFVLRAAVVHRHWLTPTAQSLCERRANSTN